MAMMPNIETSTRRLDVAPSRQYAPSIWGKVGDAVGGTMMKAGDALDRMLEIRRRADERAGDYAISQAENYAANQLGGYDVTDPVTGQPKHMPGVFERDWQSLDRDKTTVNKLVEEKLNTIHAQSFYKDLTPDQRRMFDRKWVFKADAIRRQGQEQTQRVSLKRAQDQMKTIVDDKARTVSYAYGDDDATFLRAAEVGALGIYREEMGTGLSDRTRELIDNPACTFDDVARSEGWDAAKTAANRKVFDKKVTAFKINRISAFQRAAADATNLGGMNPDACLAKADDITNNLLKEGHISEDEANAVRRETARARKSLDNHIEDARRKEFDNQLNEIGNVELDLLDNTKIESVRLDYSTYEQNVRGNPMLNETQRIKLLKDYRSLVQYKEKYDADIKKFNDAAAKDLKKAQEEYGYWDETTKRFIPASAFPQDTEMSALDEFDKASQIWSNPQTALMRLEAARMTGRVSKSDYKVAKAYGEMLMDDDAQKWWFANYGKFSVEGLTQAEYGEDGVKRDVRKFRVNKNYKSAGGIYAKTAGSRGQYMSSADFVADTLARDTKTEFIRGASTFGGGYSPVAVSASSEELVPPETLEKLYITVRRLARAGVDPANAARAILAPALQEGVARDLDARLNDPDYFALVVEDYRESGSKFAADTIAAKSGRFDGKSGGTDAQVGRIVTSDLSRQGRVKVEKSNTNK